MRLERRFFLNDLDSVESKIVEVLSWRHMSEDKPMIVLTSGLEPETLDSSELQAYDRIDIWVGA